MNYIAREGNPLAETTLISSGAQLKSNKIARWSWRVGHWLLLLTLVSASGCSGCRPADEKLSREELEKRAREQRDSLEMSNVVSLPADSETKVLYAKPGHWHETQQQFKSNREDMRVVAVGSVARGNELAQIPGTNVVNEFTRRTTLPKGQSKTIDLQYFVPYSGKKQDPFSNASTALKFRTELLSWPLMTPILQAPSTMPANELKDHEFQLVAIGPQALSYEYLTVLDAIYWRGEEFMQEERTRSYYVTLVKPTDGNYSFPHSMLTMTAIAAIVWDDVSPDDLSENQQEALIDWIHWGGQLIVSGPSSWSRLQNSFLSPYLPATSANAAAFATEDFSSLSETWIVEDRAPRATMDPITIDGAPVGGLKFDLAGSGQWLPGTGELVAESQVGRGRIVLTGFPLREPRIYRWKYFSSFFSTGLLRRHPRVFRRSEADRSIAQYWTAPFDGAQHDARLHSNMRILTRDLPLSAVSGGFSAEQRESLGMGGEAFEAVQENNINVPNFQTSGQDNSGQDMSSEMSQWGGRGAAWNDYSGLSFQALAALKAAAGIELPSRKTIIYLLAGYLLCLVPLNWLLFKLIGRLEYAWLAAPLMAMVGVAVVLKVARLDIGFARRTTEISVLEIQGDHSRGHLTQYLALYTSLSMNYAVDFPENGSVALPLGDISRSVRRAGDVTRNLRTNYGQSEGVTLEPLTVYSNSTEMLHAEQMVALDGGLRLGNRGDDGSGAPALKNELGIDLLSTMVVRRTVSDSLEVAWIGDLDSGMSADLVYQPVSANRLWENWRDSPVTQPDVPEEIVGEGVEENALWIGGVLKELVRKTPLMRGQTRLFAYTNDRPSKLTVTPEEDQFDGRCVVVAHLTPQTLGNVKPDVNIMSRLTSEDLDEESKAQAAEEPRDQDPK